MRNFEEIIVTYLSDDIIPYPEYKGKPYFSIQYEENGEHHVGYGTYNPQVLSNYIKDYFINVEEELEKINTEVNTRKKYIDGDLLFSKIAGHSDYHGDSILSAISCLQEGKEISMILAIGDNE